MTGSQVLQSVQFVTVKGKRLAFLTAEDWEALWDGWKRLKMCRLRARLLRSSEMPVEIASRLAGMEAGGKGTGQSDSVIDVLAVRKRPPYDYGDLTLLLDELE